MEAPLSDDSLVSNAPAAPSILGKSYNADSFRLPRSSPSSGLTQFQIEFNNETEPIIRHTFNDSYGGIKTEHLILCSSAFPQASFLFPPVSIFIRALMRTSLSFRRKRRYRKSWTTLAPSSRCKVCSHPSARGIPPHHSPPLLAPPPLAQAV